MTNAAAQLTLTQDRAATHDLAAVAPAAFVVGTTPHEQGTFTLAALDTPEKVICANLLISALRAAKGGALDDGTTNGD